MDERNTRKRERRWLFAINHRTLLARAYYYGFYAISLIMIGIFMLINNVSDDIIAPILLILKKKYSPSNELCNGIFEVIRAHRLTKCNQQRRPTNLIPLTTHAYFPVFINIFNKMRFSISGVLCNMPFSHLF